MNFGSYYDGPVRLAALLVNTLTPGHSGGRPYPQPDGDDQREKAIEALRSIDASLVTISAAEADRLSQFAVSLRAVFTSIAADDTDAAARHIDDLLQQTKAQPSMVRHDGQPWHVHYHGTAGGPAADWAGVCATALAIIIGSQARSRLGVCTAPHCDRVYIDTSHNGARRFCSTPCQNRVKTAAFRARTHPSPQQAASTPRP